ncbi:hypothetical protein [Nonomuraea sp. NPDC049695]|uniref:hypothetical protein n=1 Tax=Nonomuraea sp. NPDC049695 TaxID=3154734 RepID=UPI003444735A
MRLNLVFRDAVEIPVLAGFAERHDWAFQGHHPAGDSSPEELVWATPSGVGVHLVDDEVLGIAYLVMENDSISGVADMDVRDARQEVSAWFEVVESSELVELYRGAPEWNARVLLLMMLAATASEYSPDVHDVIKDGLVSAHLDVRRAAVIASMYTPWDSLRESVESIARSDSDEQLLDLAEMALTNFP